MADLSAPGQQPKPTVVQWLVDTRKLWPRAEKTAMLETEVRANEALALLNQDERKSVLKYLFVRDAKLSLVSHLLKHYAVSRLLDIPWAETRISRNARTKPVYVDPITKQTHIDFNVSHQAGLVALIAGYGFGESQGDQTAVDVGCDVVCVDEREDRDHGMIAREGWPAFVDMHADVFAPGELSYLKYQILSAIPEGISPGATQRDITNFKLRCFYTAWCLREAYVKMTGDALLAPWLNVLEFRGFKPPRPAPAMGTERDDGQDVVTEFDVRLRGQRVEDANICLRSIGPNYMTCSAVRTQQNKEIGLGLQLAAYEMVEIEQILDWAKSH
ncbi:hypothetical protein BD289DRAFT_432599 [Coniella lustricola]|uniref:holo-[acyl-carrier-protein] synthase n=1 Tax=Coniella lustricola TaxID=2025994 RepID=A0A2T3A9J3_9PEZI|nr:hypothetical protein BD289DRAFT_432599 [Coniella lustricola]